MNSSPGGISEDPVLRKKTDSIRRLSFVCFFQGVYQWESEAAAEDYKRSFVLDVMNRRATADSVTISTIPGTNVYDYLKLHLDLARSEFESTVKLNYL